MSASYGKGDFGKEAYGGETVPEPARRTKVSTHKDLPAQVDELNRSALAEVLAVRIKEMLHTDPAPPPRPAPTLWAALKVWSARVVNWLRGGMHDLPQAYESDAFMVHVDGAWGSGKSSFLNFLAVELKKADSGRVTSVVNFNAWRHHKRGTAWWTLLSEIKHQLANDPTLEAGPIHRAWWVWFLRAEKIFWWVGAGLLIGLGMILTGTSTAGGGLIAGAAAIMGSLRKQIPLLADFGRSIRLRGDDSMGLIVTLYHSLIHAAERPVVVFIDDLDRCPADWTVELLEGIQTLLRRPGVAFVIAADGQWIQTSLELYYHDFKADLRREGHRLGDLFLEKLFQVTVSIPELDGESLPGYWNALLDAEPAESTNSGQATSRARELLPEDIADEEKLLATAEAYRQESAQLATRIIVEGAKRMARADAQTAVRHRLAVYADLLPGNPRVLKRIVNDYALLQAVNLITGTGVQTGALVRWIVLRHRWPRLAALIADEVSATGRWDRGQPLPEELSGILRSQACQQVLGAPDLSDSLGDSSLTQLVRLC